MRYDAHIELRKILLRQRGTTARDFVGSLTGDPRPLGQSPMGVSSLNSGRPQPGAAPLSAGEGRG